MRNVNQKPEKKMKEQNQKGLSSIGDRLQWWTDGDHAQL